MIPRRSFLAAMGALPLLRWVKPVAIPTKDMATLAGEMGFSERAAIPTGKIFIDGDLYLDMLRGDPPGTESCRKIITSGLVVKRSCD